MLFFSDRLWDAEQEYSKFWLLQINALGDMVHSFAL